ncbi:MAG: DUF1893 domain-containing protein [Muribaculaceae bacterium]|nr:DUF1893 domain-containing protein [Muribaculaceae bacterium]
MIESLRGKLRSEGYTLVVCPTCGEVRGFEGRGVSDLYRLLNEEPDFLNGATIADKVVGRAAAALMILGGAKMVHSEVISTPALQLFDGSDVEVTFGLEVPHIINRKRDGWCPLEIRCKDCESPEECLKRIEAFINNKE